MAYNIPEMEISDRIKFILRYYGLPKKGLADMLDVDPATVHRWLKEGIPKNRIDQICRVLLIPPLVLKQEHLDEGKLLRNLERLPPVTLNTDQQREFERLTSIGASLLFEGRKQRQPSAAGADGENESEDKSPKLVHIIPRHSPVQRECPLFTIRKGKESERINHESLLSLSFERTWHHYSGDIIAVYGRPGAGEPEVLPGDIVFVDVRDNVLHHGSLFMIRETDVSFLFRRVYLEEGGWVARLGNPEQSGHVSQWNIVGRVKEVRRSY